MSDVITLDGSARQQQVHQTKFADPEWQELANRLSVWLNKNHPNGVELLWAIETLQNPDNCRKCEMESLDVPLDPANPFETVFPWCGDGDGQFWYRCPKCGSTYTCGYTLDPDSYLSDIWS